MRNPPASQLFFKFVGTWKLIECVVTDAQGNSFYPWGHDAIGYLIYTAEGIMAVQIMRKKRKLFDEKNILQATAQEGQALVQDYNAYFGHFEIDEVNTTIIHIIEGHLNPNMIGGQNIRTYNFYDNKLSLVTQGEANVKKLIWERLKVLS